MTATWPFIPQHGVTESLEWHTDVIRARDAEQRLCMRPIPRQEFSHDYQLVASDFGRAVELAKKIGGDECYLPVWEELTEVGSLGASTVTLPVDATGKCYVNGDSMIVWSSNSDWEVCTISNIGTGVITINPGTTAAHSRALAMPLRLARFEQPFSCDRMPIDMVTASARFRAIATEDLSAASGGLVYPTYKTRQMITYSSFLIGGINEESQRETETLDNGTGIIYRTPVYGGPIETSVQAWSTLPGSTIDAEKLWKVRIWIHTRKGRWKSFWLPSSNADLIITASIGENDETITIADIDYADHYPASQDFVILTTIGLSYPFRVVASNPGSGGNQILEVETPMDAVPLGIIGKCCRLNLVRFASDRIEIQHHNGGRADIAVPTVETTG